MFFKLLKYVILGPLLRLLYRPRAEGLDNIPTSGPVIIAANHLAFFDSVFLPLVVKRQVHFIGKHDYFSVPGFKGRLISGFFRGVGTIPVDRTGGEAADAALQTAERILSEDKIFGIYPEGTRSPDGRLHRGKTGVARLALKTHASVVPAAVLNTRRLQPPGRRIPKIGRARMIFGQVMDLSSYAEMEVDRDVLRAVTDDVVRAIQKLSGQEYVDVYAAKVKAVN